MPKPVDLHDSDVWTFSLFHAILVYNKKEIEHGMFQMNDGPLQGSMSPAFPPVLDVSFVNIPASLRLMHNKTK